MNKQEKVYKDNRLSDYILILTWRKRGETQRQTIQYYPDTESALDRGFQIAALSDTDIISVKVCWFCVYRDKWITRFHSSD